MYVGRQLYPVFAMQLTADCPNAGLAPKPKEVGAACRIYTRHKWFCTRGKGPKGQMVTQYGVQNNIPQSQCYQRQALMQVCQRLVWMAAQKPVRHRIVPGAVF